MPTARNVLTPEALSMMEVIARTGSFAAAARELGKVPSALTYSVRQLEDALDVLLFDRGSRQAKFTAAGEELLNEGLRLLEQMEAVASRVKRVATGWETQLTIAVDGVISRLTVFELCEAFYALQPEGATSGPGTRLRLRTEVLAGTWEALVRGHADLAIGVGTDRTLPAGIQMQPLGPAAAAAAGDGAGEVCHELVAAIGEDEEHAQVAGPGQQGGGKVAAEVERQDGGLDLVGGGRAHARAAIEHAVDGGERHPGLPRHIVHGGAPRQLLLAQIQLPPLPSAES